MAAKKTIVGANKTEYGSLAEACRAEGVSYCAVTSYAEAHNIDVQKAFLVYSAQGGNFQQKAREWTEKEDWLLISLAGIASATFIASQVGRSLLSVKKRASVLGVSLAYTQPKRLSKSDIDFICSNYGTMSQAKIAAHLGCNTATVQYHLRKNGLIQSNSKNAQAVRANSSKPAAEIAAITSSAEHTVRANATQERISLANVRKPWTKAEEDFLRANYPQVSITALAKSLGKAKNTVRTHLKVMGLYIPQP
jgi:DNA-binding CsgD family transcriptional regulator